MRTPKFRVETLIALFRQRRIVTMEQMKTALGTRVDMTVFRKLRELPYRSSYSHRGRFYTLASIAAFDDRGLWTCRGVHFSRFGSLIDTVEQFVNRSERGFPASELASELQTEVKHPLCRLVRTQRLAREQMAQCYVYYARDRSQRSAQRLHRRTYGSAEALPFARDALAETSDDTKAAIVLFLSTLDERQRRLYAGLESLRLGHGGDRRLAELTGLDVHTIAKGRAELLQRDVPLGRVRRPGGGRPALEKKRPRSSPPLTT